MQLLLAVLLAMGLSLLLGRLAITYAGRLRFLDHPGKRKLQERPVALLGGAAILLAVLAGLLVNQRDVTLPPVIVDAHLPADLTLLRWLVAGAWLVLVGLVDDRRGLGPGKRLAAQALAVLLFTPELSSWLPTAWLGAPLAFLWLLGLINSLNFLDNMDAAAAGTGFWTALALSLPLFWAGEPMLAGAALILAAALAGFLCWNLPPARLYMGDAGSTFLGLSLGLFSLLTVERVGMSPWLVPLLLAVPLYDTGTVLWIRWREGRRLWVGDRRHATHRMQARGASVGRTVAVLNLWTIASATLALCLHRMGRGGFWTLLAALALAILVFAWERREEARRPVTERPTSAEDTERRRAGNSP